MSTLNEARKAIAALLAAAVTWGTVVVESAPADITSGEWMAGAAAAVGVVVVYLVPNQPKPA
jgi:hypothetical protein